MKESVVALNALIVQILKTHFPENDPGAKERFRKVMEQAEIGPQEIEVFMRIVFPGEVREGGKKLRPLMESGIYLTGGAILYQLFGRGAGFSPKRFDRAAKQAGLGPKEENFICSHLW